MKERDRSVERRPTQKAKIVCRICCYFLVSHVCLSPTIKMSTIALKRERYSVADESPLAVVPTAAAINISAAPCLEMFSSLITVVMNKQQILQVQKKGSLRWLWMVLVILGVVLLVPMVLTIGIIASLSYAESHRPTVGDAINASGKYYQAIQRHDYTSAYNSL